MGVDYRVDGRSEPYGCLVWIIFPIVAGLPVMVTACLSVGLGHVFSMVCKKVPLDRGAIGGCGATGMIVGLLVFSGIAAYLGTRMKR